MKNDLRFIWQLAKHRDTAAPPPPPPPPGSTVPKMRVGLNLPAYNYYAYWPGPRNLMIGGQADRNVSNPTGDNNPWYLSSQIGGDLFNLPGQYTNRDASGWPQSGDFVVGCGSGLLATFQVTCRFNGQVSSVTQVAGEGVSGLSSVSYNSGTNRSTFTFTMTGAPGILPPRFRFQGASRTPSTPNTGITNLEFLRNEDLTGTGYWSQKFIQETADFAHLRPLVTMNTINDLYLRDTPYNFAGDPHQITTWGMVVSLANELGHDLMVAAPINVTDRWLAAWIAYLDAAVTDPNRRIYLSCSDENWNTFFTNNWFCTIAAATELRGAVGDATYHRYAGREMVSWSRSGGRLRVNLDFSPSDIVVGTQYIVNGFAGHFAQVYDVAARDVTNKWIEFVDGGADQATTTSGLTGGLPSILATGTGSTLIDPNYDPWNAALAAVRWGLRRTMQISDICRATVGDAKMMTRFCPVLEIQMVNGGSWELDYVAWLAGGASQVKTKFYSMAAAPYLSLTPTLATDTSPHTQADYISDMRTMADSYEQYFPGAVTARVKCCQYGIKYASYEGGVGTDGDKGTTNNTTCNTAKLSDEMAPVITDYLNEMASRDGFEVFTQYSMENYPSGSSYLYTWGFTDLPDHVTGYWQGYKNYITEDDSLRYKTNQIGGAVGSTTRWDTRLLTIYRENWDLTGVPYPLLNTRNGNLEWLWWSDYPGTYTLTISYAFNDFNDPGNPLHVPTTFNEQQLTVNLSGTGSDLNAGLATVNLTVTVLQGWNALRMTGANYNNFTQLKNSFVFFRTA
jgi:hypothetical protein